MPNKTIKRMAIFMDFTVPINRREGITAYVGYLMNAILQTYEKAEIEIWLYSHNEDNFNREYNDILDKYGNRVFVYNERSEANEKRIEVVHYIKYQIYKFGYYICKMLHVKSIEDSFGYRAAFHLGMHNQLIYDLPKAFNSLSEAEIVFVPFPGLTAALRINKKVFIQIHDLFTFPLENLFEKESSSMVSFKKNNKNIKKILEQYASKGAVFISSSNYTVSNQILKYIDGTNKRQCKVISFPPMVGSYTGKTVISEYDFRRKYDIETQYVAFPSQNRPNKNLILLLKALEILNEDGYNIKLVTTGKMSHCNSTSKFAENDKRHIVIELNDLNLDELYCLYKYAELVVCPNIIEGLGISGQCLEGLAIGKPVIHAKSMGIEDSLRSVGLDIHTAKLQWVDLDDSIGLAKRIKYVMSHKEEVIKEQRNVLTAYTKKTWDDVAREYMEVFTNN